MFATPQEAEEAFYQAFARANLDAMMAVWDESESNECIHPRGERIRGSVAIAESWRQIFAAAPRMRIRIEGQNYTQTATLAVHVVTEIIDVDDPESQPAQVTASNVYQLTDSGWRLTLHHASPATPRPPPPRHSREQVLH
ncbi:MAG: hypothetical protein AMJ69_07670 [Gammaproteobacteria bacterium SG8_47]|nr:MAG: hypothetical protein AMJ69_07670 [Gammaproteobacteria bacterium SG8_47]